MDRTCTQSRARSPFTSSDRNDTTSSGKRKTIKKVESLAGELIASLKAINSQDPDIVHVRNIQSLATASECRKLDNNSPTAGSNNTKSSMTNNTKDFHCPSTREREQQRAWNLIYENFKQGNFRTSPTQQLEQQRKPYNVPRGCIALSPEAKSSTDTHWESKSESAKEKMTEKLATGTCLQEAEWAHENLGRAGMDELSTEEQEAMEFARDCAVIDYSDDELDSDSDSDSDDDDDDFPHLYATIPMPSQTPTGDDDLPNFCASPTTPPETQRVTEGSEVATNNSKALFNFIKGPPTPPLTPNLKYSEPESKRELALINALINDLGQRLITYQDLTDDVFIGSLYNANPEPEVLSVKSFCSWKLHPFSEQMKDSLPPATRTVPDIRLIDSEGDVYSLEERMDILDEFEDREFGRHLASRDEWQFQKERWFLRNSTAAENEARLQHLERWDEEGRTM